MYHEDRIATYKENARKARARANADWQSADNHSARFQGGQPILVGHHSEKSAHRARSRADAAMRRYIKNQQAAQYWERKARAAEQHQQQKHDPGVIQRRIARMEAEQRQIDRQHEQAEGHHAEQLNEQSRKLTQELEQNRTELEDTDAKIWGREDFNKGDYAHHDGTWYEIKRVNAKSVTVAAIVGSDHARLQLGGSQVYRLQDNPYTWTDTLTYTKITGRISAQDMADKMPR